MLNLNDYKENIDFEFSNFNKKAPIKAFKTDNEDKNLKQKISLKKKLNLNCIKSCDYISFRGKSTLTLIECSDLNRQAENLNEDLSNLIKSCEQMNNKELKKHAKQVKKTRKEILDQAIQSELMTKYKDTLHLVNEIMHLKKIDKANRFKKRNFIVITNSLNTSSPEESLALDNWKRNLKNSLQSGLECLVTNVKVVTPEKFLKDTSVHFN